MFYVISGFLISLILNNSPAYQHVKTFYINRWLRLYPVYYVVAGLSLVVIPFVDPPFLEAWRHLPSFAAVCVAFANLLLVGQDWIMFSAVHHGHFEWTANFQNSDIDVWRALLVPQAWTLGVEISFYLIAPFVLKKTWKVIALLVASIAARAYLVHLGLAFHDPWTYRFFPAELCLFLLGALTERHALPRWKRLSERHKSLPLAGTCVLIAVSAGWFAIPMMQLQKMVLLFLLFIPLLPLSFLFQNQYRFDKKIGDLSYPIYIVHHLVVQVIAFGLVRFALGPFVLTALNMLVTLVAAYLLDLFVAEPVEALRKRIAKSHGGAISVEGCRQKQQSPGTAIGA
jgi:peptidoglycan/LPS O-acetylase OafA/YrhL